MSMVFLKTITKFALKIAQNNWNFECNIFANEINPEGVILLINNLSPNRGVK